MLLMFLTSLCFQLSGCGGLRYVLTRDGITIFCVFQFVPCVVLPAVFLVITCALMWLTHPHISSHGPLKTSSHPAVHVHVSPILTCCIENPSEVVPSFPLFSGAAWLLRRGRCFLDSALMCIFLETRRDCSGKTVSSRCRMPWSGEW